jgi:hypothetical protein
MRSSRRLSQTVATDAEALIAAYGEDAYDRMAAKRGDGVAGRKAYSRHLSPRRKGTEVRTPNAVIESSSALPTWSLEMAFATLSAAATNMPSAG